MTYKCAAPAPKGLQIHINVSFHAAFRYLTLITEAAIHFKETPIIFLWVVFFFRRLITFYSYHLMSVDKFSSHQRTTTFLIL